MLEADKIKKWMREYVETDIAFGAHKFTPAEELIYRQGLMAGLKGLWMILNFYRLLKP